MSDDEFKNIVLNSSSMSEACSKIGIHFNTFKKRALKLGCYKPNQGRKDCKKIWVSERKIPLNEILEGRHPQYQTFKLKKRLYESGLKKNKCEKCGLNQWNNKAIECELDHIDGNSKNHSIENLRILCPNCHSQTDTFRAKNIAVVVE